MDLNLKDHVAVITGGAAGIGEAIARALAAEDCTICILDINADAAHKAASAIETGGKRAMSAATDVGDAAAVRRVFAQFVERAKRIDILVNAAGLLSTGPTADLTAAEWQKVSEVNLAGVLYCAQAVIPIMSKQRSGRIINIASVAAMRGGGTVGNALYGATKAGVVALTMGLRASSVPTVSPSMPSLPPLPIPR